MNDTSTADEAALRGHAAALVRAVAGALPGWVDSSVRRVAADQGLRLDADADAAIGEAATRCGHEVGAEVAGLLDLDIDDQFTNPLQLLRGAVRYPTTVLDGIGAAAVVRDRFVVEAFPDDRYDLAPAAFADIDPALQDPGLVWGAAKAHVHLRRRRAEGLR